MRELLSFQDPEVKALAQTLESLQAEFAGLKAFLKAATFQADRPEQVIATASLSIPCPCRSIGPHSSSMESQFAEAVGYAIKLVQGLLLFHVFSAV